MVRCKGENNSLVAAIAMALVTAMAAPLGAADLTAPRPVSRVQLAAPADSMRMRQVVERASRRLRTAECQRLFSEFNDEAGQPLQARLDALGFTGETYLNAVVFRDGSGSATCAEGKVLAFTSPGSRVVRVCAGPLFQTLAYDPGRVEVTVIHETLHTLGLGENPPTSREITASVRQRCQ